MATIRKETPLKARAEDVWAVLRDVGAVHLRLAPGFVTDTRLDGEARVVTFANGLVARELIVTVDEAVRRVAYAAVGGRLAHHNASMQVVAEGGASCRLVWIADLLPNDMAGAIGQMMEHGSAVMKETLERAARGAA
jgi:carbon monoxide dehydrogenase subunit G